MESTRTRGMDLESIQPFVSRLGIEEIHNVLEHLAGPGANDEFGPEWVELVRTLLLRRLDSFSRGRRGLVSVPRPDPP